MLPQNPKNFTTWTNFNEEKLKFCLKWKFPKLARQVGISRSTLYEEIKRGTVTQLNSDLTCCQKYFSNVGQRVYEFRRKNCRKPFKISQVEDFLNFAEEKILINGRRILSAAMQNFTICVTKWFAPKRFTTISNCNWQKSKILIWNKNFGVNPRSIIHTSISKNWEIP